ncbi:hypothetical protein Tco_0257581 [Tanacetum coccineum]
MGAASARPQPRPSFSSCLKPQTRPQPQTQTPMQVAEGNVGPPPDKGVSILGRPIVHQLPFLLLFPPHFPDLLPDFSYFLISGFGHDVLLSALKLIWFYFTYNNLYRNAIAMTMPSGICHDGR